MESILFSLNSVLPLFLMGAAGFLLVQRGAISREFADQASNLCFKLLIPFSLFQEVYEAEILNDFNPVLVGFCIAGVLIEIVLTALIWPHFMKDRVRCGACIHSTYRSNVVLMGIPILTNMFGDAGSVVAAMAMPFVVILYNISAVTVFTAYAPDSAGAKLDLKKLLLSIAKNPFIIAILLGLVCQLSGISFPVFANKSIDYLAGMSTPLALIAVGGQFDPQRAAGNLRLNLTICSLRLLVIPTIAIAAAVAFGFRGAELAFIMVVFGSPSAVSGAALAKVMGSDYELTGQITLMSSLLSAFSFFIIVTLLRSLSLV